MYCTVYLYIYIRNNACSYSKAPVHTYSYRSTCTYACMSTCTIQVINVYRYLHAYILQGFPSVRNHPRWRALQVFPWQSSPSWWTPAQCDGSLGAWEFPMDNLGGFPGNPCHKEYGISMHKGIEYKEIWNVSVSLIHYRSKNLKIPSSHLLRKLNKDCSTSLGFDFKTIQKSVMEPLDKHQAIPLMSKPMEILASSSPDVTAKARLSHYGDQSDR